MKRRWPLFLSLLAAAACAAPALAQWPTAQSAPALAPAPPRPPRHKPPANIVEPADAAMGDTKLTLLGQYGDWGAYSASPGGGKICFASAKPSSSETDPPGKSRNPSFIFISSRPAEKVSNEVSIIIGYPFQPKLDATLEVGSASFALATKQDGAWIKNPTEEAGLIEAMRAGQNAVLKGKSAKGTRSTDVFALKGLGEALDRSVQDCK
jgi:hypothetical protein